MCLRAKRNFELNKQNGAQKLEEYLTGKARSRQVSGRRLTQFVKLATHLFPYSHMI